MAGHSKWANIQHRKGAQDKKRAKVFSKCSKLIMTAVRHGGPDPDMNLSLRYAIDKARQVNMPRDNIERAIKAASGADGNDNFEEVMYEGYGPSGTAFMIQALTDNRNRTAPELRKIFEKAGGNLGTTGSVVHQFERKAVFTVPKDGLAEERMMNLAIEWGADDVVAVGDLWEVTGAPDVFSAIRSGMESEKFDVRSSGVAMLPTATIEVTDEDTAAKVVRLMDALDDHDDVDQVYTNVDIPDAIIEKVTG